MTTILEAALYVADIDRAEAFYGETLGFERVLRAGERHVFFRVGETILLLFNPDRTETPSAPDADLPVPPHGARGQGHVCFGIGPDEFEGWRKRLLGAGIAIEADFRWPNGARSIYFRDPDGNSLECAEPRLWFDK